MSAGVPPSKLAGANFDPFTIGLIDFYRLTQECLTKVFDDLHPEITIISFMTVNDCISEGRSDFDLIIYNIHGSNSSDAKFMQAVTTVCQAFPAVPTIIFSDADCTQRSKIMRVSLNCGARGFIPTQTASLPVTLAAIRFVKEGGTFVPADLLLTSRPDRAPARQDRLTSRQVVVLSHLRQGKANKIIAYELGMTENTVRVHVRNIRRKLGTISQSQVTYNAQRLSNDLEDDPE